MIGRRKSDKFWNWWIIAAAILNLMLAVFNVFSICLNVYYMSKFRTVVNAFEKVVKLLKEDSHEPPTSLGRRFGPWKSYIGKSGGLVESGSPVKSPRIRPKPPSGGA